MTKLMQSPSLYFPLFPSLSLSLSLCILALERRQFENGVEHVPSDDNSSTITDGIR